MPITDVNHHEAALTKPKLLIISSVLPFPLTKGQRLRVYYKLLALRTHFHVTFLTVVMPAEVVATRRALADLADNAIVLPRRTHKNGLSRVYHAARGRYFAARHSLRLTNYIMGEVELSAERIAAHVDPAQFAVVVYEYWHMHKTTALFRPNNTVTVLDLHDFIWRAYSRILRDFSPPWAKIGWQRKVTAYRRQEEAAWQAYDALVAINQEEAAYLEKVAPDKTVIHTPMGTDLAKWPYRWQPVTDPPRLGYFGALDNIGNQEAVVWCVERILPHVWAERPDIEFWIVGSNPPARIRALAEQDQRIHVTGFIDEPAEEIGRMTAVLCPWRGRFGFRSRVIELLSVGTPVVATPDAVSGMELIEGEGLLLDESDTGLAAHCLRLLTDSAYATEQSRAGRRQSHRSFSFDATYGQLAEQLYAMAVEQLST
jgi:glycosyltransferase involved in cell wall biosynthesis